MSTLIEKLEFIWHWLEEINPDPDRYEFRLYQPGLSRSQITTLTKDLPFQLPEEICQLYEWCNGASSQFDTNSLTSRGNYLCLGDYLLFKDQLYDDMTMEFFSLKTAVEDYQIKISQLNLEPNENWEEEGWLLIAGCEATELYIDCSTIPPQVLLCNTDNLPHIARTYKSLTAMISVIVECCEMDVYQVVPDKYGEEGDLKIEIDKTKWELEREIFNRYNT